MRLACTFLSGLVLVLAAGCGSSASAPPDFGGEDGKQIADLVDRMNDESNTTSRLKSIFATGTAIEKKQTKTYPQYRYDLKGKVAVSGTTATGTVAVEKQAGGDSGEKEWTFVKEGDKWKIKTAPLP